MKPQSSDRDTRQELRPLLEAVVSLIDQPAAIVADGDEVLACNAHWLRIIGGSTASEDDLPLTHCLQGFAQVDELITLLRSKERDTGTTTTHRDVNGSSNASENYEVHWRRVRIRSQRDSLTIITLQGQPDQQSSVPTAAHQQARIDRLLVRQALIEESERRRIGRALHDVVVQDLAQTRSIVRASGMNAEDAAKIVASIDRMIDQVRTLTFELGPPILEDLGLRPALQWLAEHLRERYSADIMLADDDCDPRLSKQAQTIIFRATRELAINAAKHAPNAEIVISCISNHNHVRVIVKDNGPGFDTSILYDPKDDIQHYGLLSVEQQVRGVGGAFEIISEIGAGTRAIITASLDLKKGAQNGSQHG